MCGILGIFSRSEKNDYSAKIKTSLNKLKHRGPDDEGQWSLHFPFGLIVLAHTRLAIIDLSKDGHQPMHSRNNKYSIVFNGEIFNYIELRKELKAKGHRFKTNTDTEVLLTAYEHWGIKCLQRLEGMFAFAVYDKEQQKLFCARDAFGIKPFFYYYDDENFAFSSEISPLIDLIDKKPAPDFQRCYDYLVHGDLDSQERTFFKGIKHLRPAHYLLFDFYSHKLENSVCWWNPKTKQQNIGFNEAAEVIRDRFLKNISMHLRSDVMIGSALSGGIDSSSVVYAIRYLEPDADIHTFSFIAKGSGLSEERWIDMVNNSVDAIPHKVIITENDLSSDLDLMIKSQGEPFGSTSIYAQYKVFQKAKEQGITVTLDGQGADELFAGYLGYPGHRLLSLIETGRLRHSLYFAKHWGQWPDRKSIQAWKWLGRISFPDLLYATGRYCTGRNFCPSWLRIGRLRDEGVIFREKRPVLSQKFKGRRVIEQLKNSLTGRGLPALLRYADRNSMYFSIESRVPFLTTPMANITLSLPESYLISDNGETKSVFRKAMQGIVPDEILYRKDKIGFTTPESEWIISNILTLRKNLGKNAKTIDFIDADELLKSFDKEIAMKKYNSQIWRWINFTLWFKFFINEQ